MNTDMAPARPAQRDVGALLRHADEQARAADGVPMLVRQRLVPDIAASLREDDLSVAGGFADSVARQLVEALCPPGESVEIAPIVRDIVLADSTVTRLLHARAIEARLCRNAPMVGLAMAELPPRVEAHVGDAQDELAEAAMALIVAQSRFIGNAQSFAIDLSELPPEALSALVRRMLGWMQDHLQASPLALRQKAEALLGQFDERRGRPHRLMRFCHLFALPRAGDTWALSENGPSLIFAMLARASGLPADYIIDMARDADLARLSVLLRGYDVAPDVAARLIEGIAMLASLRLEGLPSAATLAAIVQDDAARMIASWRNQLPLTPLGSVW
ncbi:hypothetical protein [Blastomonas sp.]|uniref:hypothetical protein n=1 Tax=Blastomonas sp. TaxID=1909299 RepID=UPI00262FE136|nr:hypothetical protein [Blastomonas sp.]MDM7954836.1 hypothetical protein [Blastomonas sp.]